MNDLTIGDHKIRRDGDMWCLTDMWRAEDSPVNLRPSDWLKTDAAKLFVEFIEDSLKWAPAPDEKQRAIRVVHGGTDPATWAHWQIALAYAKALSPAFHARVNEVYRAFTAGLLAPRPDIERELIALTLRLRAAEEGRKSVWTMELKLELCRLRKVVWNGSGAEPQQLAAAYGRTWRIILGDGVYEELRKRNPNPREGSLHSAWLQDRRYELVKDADMAITIVTARRCSRWSEFEQELRGAFRRAPVQLRIVGAGGRSLVASKDGASR